MAYRFCDNTKWLSDKWFIDLTAHQKLMFLYLCDNCDIAGFYELSLRRMSFDLQLSVDEVKASFKAISKCYILSTDKHILLLKNFLKHQKNLPIRTDNKSHQGILKRFELFKERFSEDIFVIATHNKIHDSKGLGSPPGKGNGNSIGNGIIQFADYLKGIEFENFWSLYNKKVGDKKACEKKWNNLNIDLQNKILAFLPKWKLLFKEIQFQPYPATFLNQERWNDEILENINVVSSEYPNHWSQKFEDTLNGAKVSEYWKHLRSLGLKPDKDRFNKTIGWSKAS